MLKRKSLAVLIALLVASSFVLTNCSDEDNSNHKPIADIVIDSFAESIAENLTNVEVKALDPQEGIKPEKKTELMSQIEEFVIVDNILYAVFDGGMVAYDFELSSQKIYMVDDKLETITVHDNIIYAGGDKLYCFENESLTENEIEQINSKIKKLYSFGNQLMIGTSSGLYSKLDESIELLFEDVNVTSMTADNDLSLWVGTKGQGLYRWDGELFKKRYLLRDTTLFDSVNTISFGHNHLYVGTTNGLHIYDGGRWNNLTEMNGLPDNNVISIDASSWILYVGTENGVVSYFKSEIDIVDKLEKKAVNDLKLYEKKIIAATDFEGILIKKGPVLSTLIQPVIDLDIQFLSLVMSY